MDRKGKTFSSSTTYLKICWILTEKVITMYRRVASLLNGGAYLECLAGQNNVCTYWDYLLYQLIELVS